MRIVTAALALGLVSTLVRTAAADDRTSAPDSRAGHVYLAPSVTLAKALGSAETALSLPDVVGWGNGAAADLGVGISRYVVLGATGSFARYGGGGVCTGCRGSDVAGGVFAQYHLVVGTPFDPWVGLGIGWRATSLEAPGGATTKYGGPDWLKLSVGGDWYPTGLLGLGPWLGLDLGRDTSRSPGEIPSGANAFHTTFTLGLRVVLDPLR